MAKAKPAFENGNFRKQYGFGRRIFEVEPSSITVHFFLSFYFITRKFIKRQKAYLSDL